MTTNDQKVVMMGLGYIGLPTAALIASKKIPVHGVDVNKDVVNTINKGEIHIVEPDLDGLVKNCVERGFLIADTQPCEADVYLIAVPTPFKGNYEPDISYVLKATEMLCPKLKEGDLVILESTSPVGTTEKMAEFIWNLRPELKGALYIAYCPERVLPGNVIYELEHNDRVIGGLDKVSTQHAIAFYRQFVKGKLHKTNARTAEMCKLVENSSRDNSIAFANELSMICDTAEINVWELIDLANRHPRVNILKPGTGVGGHCIAVDPWFIVSEFPEQAKIIRQSREINNYKTEWALEKIRSSAFKFKAENGRVPKIACMGLAFKPDIDDLRESPALKLVSELLAADEFEILPVEPNIKHSKGVDLYPYAQAMEEADIVVFLVGHREFYDLDVEDKIVLNFCGVTKVVKEYIQ
ncbi:MAG: UDP-N-acetyl-D-mannosaminuronic acid dehydrogenase [Flavobacteriales bacterium]|jgi:UDP-N-acetyl-D-mannosaminuronic acid dehydrogenase